MSLTVQQLRALVSVVDRGSFTLAAADLGVSQSAVSHAIAGMERELGGALIVRESPLAPTPLGHRVLAHARSAAAAIDALESAARGDGSLRGVVRLGTVPTVCQGLLPSLLEEWSIALPGVRVEVYEGDDDEIPEWLTGGLVDLAILVEPETLPEGSKIVDIDEFAAVVREDHPFAENEAIPLEELTVDGLIVSTGGCEAHVQRLHESAGIEFNVRHRVREMSTLFAMVKQGLGVSIVPSLGRGLLPAGLSMLPLLERQARRLVLAGPENREQHPLVAPLIAAASTRRTMSQVDVARV